MIRDSAPTKAVAITPSDATDLGALGIVRLVVGVGGTLSFKLDENSSAVSLAVFPGQTIDGTFIRVMAATTATVVGFSQSR